MSPATPASAMAGPRPMAGDCSPATPPTAPATAPTDSAVALARVGYSSPDQAPITGVAALAEALHSRLPAMNPTVPVTNPSPANIVYAAVSTTPGVRRPSRSVRMPPARYETSATAPETKISHEMPAGEKCSVELAKTV